MAAMGLFLLTLLISVHGTSADITMTQSPTVESVAVGGSITLNCRSSSSDLTTGNVLEVFVQALNGTASP
ncbi:hypothetical protein COCON_G00118740 [Conger conger]|uniref:Uncharacterized protein n=1 Tax=Conger conger TaxID=82655 RepID=A0A9Q1DGD4_CONCO|nr:hypothetical protein COCON_G00118740 [Conger conger]